MALLTNHKKIHGFSIDLHGRTRDEALFALNQILNEASWQRNRNNYVLLKIDAGVGKHSGHGGPVLQPFTRELLQHRGYNFYEKSGKFYVIVWHNCYNDDDQLLIPEVTKKPEEEPKKNVIGIIPPKVSSRTDFPELGQLGENFETTNKSAPSTASSQRPPYFIKQQQHIKTNPSSNYKNNTYEIKQKRKQREKGRSRKVMNETIQEVNMIQEVLDKSKQAFEKEQLDDELELAIALSSSNHPTQSSALVEDDEDTLLAIALSESTCSLSFDIQSGREEDENLGFESSEWTKWVGGGESSVDMETDLFWQNMEKNISWF